MRWFRFAVFVVIAMILQTGLVDVVALVNVKLDLLLILLVFFSIYCKTTDAVIASFAIGFAADIIGPVMGPQTISFGLFGSSLAYLQRVMTINKMPHQSLVIAVVGLLAGGTACFLTYLKGQPAAPNTFTILLGTSLYSAVVGPFLFLPSAWWMRIKTHRFTRQQA